MTIRLPATTGITFTVTIPAAVAPYFQSYYDDSKKPGESPSDFVVRQFRPAVVEHVKQKYIVPQRDQANNLIQSADAEARVILGELGG